MLANHVGVGGADQFTSYSLRRDMPTLANLRQAPEEEADALGDWLTAKSATMRIRYSDQRGRTALMAKLLQAEIVGAVMQQGQSVMWQSVPALLNRVYVGRLGETVNMKLAAEDVVYQSPDDWLQTFIQEQK